jgi:hypothetical protein
MRLLPYFIAWTIVLVSVAIGVYSISTWVMPWYNEILSAMSIVAKP